jgi:hypothetical protein
MRFLSFIMLGIAAMLSTAEACKCLNSGGDENIGGTAYCCGQLDGSFQDGNDCAADSISEHLSEFRYCCEDNGSVTSDCDFPKEEGDGTTF